MAVFQPGLVHTPVTPFTSDDRIDFERYAKVLEFHLANGADALALPMHVGESVSLSDGERHKLLVFAMKQIGGRVPVIAHVSQSGTALAADLARQGEQAGAAAVIATSPYYWTPQPAMLLEHFVQIAHAVQVPLFVHNAPDEMGGIKVTTDLTLKLIGKCPNFAGLVDSSLDWQFLIDVVSNARRMKPDFQLLSGLEFYISAGAIGANGGFAPLAGVAPRLVRRLYELCRQEAYGAARPPQETLAALYQAVKPGGVAGVKAAMRQMGRDVGVPRTPVPALDEAQSARLTGALAAIEALQDEPQGW